MITAVDFFGWWWAPNNPLIEAVEANPGAEWKPYVIADEYGEVHSYIYEKHLPVSWCEKDMSIRRSS